jgi:hypothetical protein
VGRLASGDPSRRRMAAKSPDVPADATIPDRGALRARSSGSIPISRCLGVRAHLL